MKAPTLVVLSLIALLATASCRLFPPVQAPFDSHRDLRGSLAVFPGAEGFGTHTIAGRGGAVVRVTSLADSGPGPLGEAVAVPGPRVVVFEVGGVISLSTPILVREPFLTLAGQTAPDPGITLVGSGIVVSTHDVLIQHIRSRPGDRPDGADPEARDGISVVGDARGERAVYNVVIDRCSISWAIDEGASTWYMGVSDVTFSNSIIAENLSNSLQPKGEHSKGLLVGDHSRRIAVTGNLFAHNMRRNPLLKGDTSTVVAGNLIYNPGTQAIGFSDPEWSGPSRATVVGNLVIAGSDSGPASDAIWRGAETSDRMMVYAQDNLLDDGETREWVPGARMDRVMVTVPPVSFQPATFGPASALESTLLARAGARAAARDEVDERIVQSVADRTGRIIDSQDDVGGYPEPEATVHPLALPPDPHADDDGDGYTNLEHWLHALAQTVEGSIE
jgi:hypothetical protein